MESLQSYRDLRVWREAMSLAEMCYGVTRDYPRAELYGLVSQTRRAAVSVAANIAEGYGRENTGSYVHFLRIAQGSCKELETHIILAERVLGIDGAAVLAQSETVGKMLRGLMKSIQAE